MKNPLRISANLIDEERAAEFLSFMITGGEECCPQCFVQRRPKRFFRGRVVRCPECDKKYTWRTGTMFEGAKLTAAQIALIFDRLTLGRTDKEIADEMGISIDTVKIWRHKYGLIW